QTAAKWLGVAEAAGARGAMVRPFTEQGQTLRAALAHSLERFAPGSNERHAAELAIQGLTPAPLPEGIAGTNDALFGGGLTYQRLDDILTRVQGVKGASVVAGLVRAARDAISKQVPEEAKALRGAYRASTLDRLALPSLLRAGWGL